MYICPSSFILRKPFSSIAIRKKLNSTKRGAFFDNLRLQGDHYCACARKWCHFSYFSKTFQTKKKFKKPRPKMTKIASRGSCLHETDRTVSMYKNNAVGNVAAETGRYLVFGTTAQLSDLSMSSTGEVGRSPEPSARPSAAADSEERQICTTCLLFALQVLSKY